MNRLLYCQSCDEILPRKGKYCDRICRLVDSLTKQYNLTFAEKLILATTIKGTLRGLLMERKR